MSARIRHHHIPTQASVYCTSPFSLCILTAISSSTREDGAKVIISRNSCHERVIQYVFAHTRNLQSGGFKLNIPSPPGFPSMSSPYKATHDSFSLSIAPTYIEKKRNLRPVFGKRASLLHFISCKFSYYLLLSILLFFFLLFHAEPSVDFHDPSRV